MWQRYLRSFFVTSHHSWVHRWFQLFRHLFNLPSFFSIRIYPVLSVMPVMPTKQRFYFHRCQFLKIVLCRSWFEELSLRVCRRRTWQSTSWTIEIASLRSQWHQSIDLRQSNSFKYSRVQFPQKLKGFYPNIQACAQKRCTAETTLKTGLRHPTNKRVRRCISTNMYESNPLFRLIKRGC